MLLWNVDVVCERAKHYYYYIKTLQILLVLCIYAKGKILALQFYNK